MKLKNLFKRKLDGTFHTNPDGLEGGFIPSSSEVHPSTFVGRTAIIMPNVKIGPNQHIVSGEIVTPDGSVLRFGGHKTRHIPIP